ncbi:hypothetical protein BH10BAC2_BH10BAC2_39120 [soil metagenome]
MKVLSLIIFFTITYNIGFAQNSETDSLKHELAIAKQDSNQVLIMASLCYAYSNSIPDSAMFFAVKGLALSKKINFTRGEARVLHNQGRLYRILGDYSKGLEILFQAVQIAKDNNLKYEEADAMNLIGITYSLLQDFQLSINYFKKSAEILAANKDLGEGAFEYNLNMNFSDAYRKSGQLDSALTYLQKAKSKISTSKRADETSRYFYGLAAIQFKKGEHNSAFKNLNKSISLAQTFNSHRFLANSYNLMADFFRELNQGDSSIYYAEKALSEAKIVNFKESMIESSKFLARQYESKDIKQALYYHKVYDSINEDVFGSKKVKALQTTLSNEHELQRQIEAERISVENRLKQYAFLASLGILLLIAFILYRNNKKQKKANKQLQEQTDKVENTLSQLKTTQAQLIQKEKLASLGELTAGIAHEIQNPLNFVNNFSEVNTELIDELQGERSKAKDERDEKLEEVLLNDIKENEKKISHHGKRAGDIVRGMLQHSKSGTGKKEPTDINALCDEYSRLAYHGLKAKDKDFNAEMQTDFDETIGKINIVPQDIGRVLLNLYNNAFYAVREKKKQQAENYEPTVSVSTKKINGKVEISVKDNGDGIPQKIVDKIFQPFFTTKPTGQGTGLGLSLSYDIITKQHNGNIKAESKENEGSAFIIQLPFV